MAEKAPVGEIREEEGFAPAGSDRGEEEVDIASPPPPPPPLPPLEGTRDVGGKEAGCCWSPKNEREANEEVVSLPPPPPRPLPSFSPPSPLPLLPIGEDADGVIPLMNALPPIKGGGGMTNPIPASADNEESLLPLLLPPPPPPPVASLLRKEEDCRAPCVD